MNRIGVSVLAVLASVVSIPRYANAEGQQETTENNGPNAAEENESSTALLEFHGEADAQYMFKHGQRTLGGAVDLEIAKPGCCALGAYVATRALQEDTASAGDQERRLLDGGAQITVPACPWFLFRLRAGKAGTQPHQLDSGRTGYVLGAAAIVRVTELLNQHGPGAGEFAPVLDLVVNFSQVNLSALRNSNDEAELHAQYLGVGLRLGVEYGLSLGAASDRR
jgi:hypothetical protein